MPKVAAATQGPARWKIYSVPGVKGVAEPVMDAKAVDGTSVHKINTSLYSITRSN